MSLAVVVLNWNAEHDTDRCLRSIASWQGRGRVAAPTCWVVDNGSEAAGLQWLEARHPDVKFLRSPRNLGFAGGNNRGLEAALEAGSERILLLNNDATLDDASLESMLNSMATDSKVGIVGPTLWDGDRLISAGGRDIARFGATHFRPVRIPADLFDVDYVSGTVALISSHLLETVGLLEVEYFFSGEMADLGLRARREGFRCVTDPGARAQHDLSRSSVHRDRLHAYYVIRNRFLYVRKHYPDRQVSLTALWILRAIKAATSSLLRGNPGRARAQWLGLADGLSRRFGGQNERVLGTSG